MLDDAALLRRYATEKSETAFAELVARHIDVVYSAALRQLGGDTHQAQDVSQIVFATLARRASSLIDHPVLAGWLYNTTRHVAQRTRRAAQRRRAREEEAARMNAIDTGTAEWEQIRPVLDDAMRQLGERDREALVLRFFARRPFAEIGRAMGLSEDATRMRVQRALEKLRTRLGQHGVTSTASMLSLVLTQHAVGATPAAVTAAVAGSALASTTATAGLVFTMAEIMSTSKIVIGAAGAAVLLLVTTTLHEWQARAASGEALAQAQSAHAALQMRFQSLGERVRRSEAEAATLRAQSTNAQAAVPRATSVVPGRSEAEEADAFLARHPELKRLAWQQRRAQVEGSYEPLFKLLRLTPEQVGRFVDLVSQGASGSFAGPNGEVIRYTLEGDRRQAEAELRLMLGEDGFKVYTTYFDTIGPAWQTAIQLAGDLSHSPTPLTAAQGEQVLRILIDGRVATDWSARPQFDWPAIMAQARGVLTPEQISALSDLSAHDRFGQAVTRARRRGELQ